MTLYIERNDSLEIVTREYPFRDTMISRITWIDPCRYNLVWINPKTYFDSFILKVSPQRINTIKQVTANYVLVASGHKFDTLWKAN